MDICLATGSDMLKDVHGNTGSSVYILIHIFLSHFLHYSWKGGAIPRVDSPPELQHGEVVDLAEEGAAENVVFGFVELESLVNAFEPTVSSIRVLAWLHVRP